MPDASSQSADAGSSAQEGSRATLFDPSLPGASAVYAAPQSGAPRIIPRLPAHLRITLLCAGLFIILSVVYNSITVVTTLRLLTADHISWSAELLAPVTAWHRMVQRIPAINAWVTVSLKAGWFLTVAAWHVSTLVALRRLHRREMLPHHPAAGMWWLVPVANLFMPFFSLRQMRHLTTAPRAAPCWRPSADGLLMALEASWPISVISGFMVSVWVFMLGAAAAGKGFFAASFVASVCSVLSGILLLQVMQRVFSGQKRLYQHCDNQIIAEAARSMEAAAKDE